MKQVKVVLALAMMLIASGGFSADNPSEKKVLTLSQAQEMAMQNSLSIKDANLDLDAAQKKIWETTATGLPQADAKYSLSYNPSSLPEIQFDPNSPPIKIGTKTSSSITATVSQLIFSGSYIVGLQSAKTYKEIIQQSLLKTQVDVKAAVAQSYYLVLLSMQTGEVLKGNLENLKKILDDAQKTFEKGFAEETDVDQLRLSINNLETTLKTVQNRENVARRLLNYQIGFELNTLIEPSDKLESIVLGINRERVVQTPFAIDKNIDYSIAQTNIKAKKLLLRLEYVSYLPTVAGFYQYQKYLEDQSFNFQPTNLLGLSITLPIFSSGQRYSKVQQAKINLSKAENARVQAERALTMEYQQAREDFNTAWEQYLNSKSSLGLAQKVLKDMTIKYSNGLASGMDLTQANDKVLQAISTLYGVEYDLLNAKIRLDKVTSNL
jgi:outer membrane protein TolC